MTQTGAIFRKHLESPKLSGILQHKLLRVPGALWRHTQAMPALRAERRVPCNHRPSLRRVAPRTRSHGAEFKRMEFTGDEKKFYIEALQPRGSW